MQEDGHDEAPPLIWRAGSGEAVAAYLGDGAYGGWWTIVSASYAGLGTSISLSSLLAPASRMIVELEFRVLPA